MWGLLPGDAVGSEYDYYSQRIWQGHQHRIRYGPGIPCVIVYYDPVDFYGSEFCLQGVEDLPMDLAALPCYSCEQKNKAVGVAIPTALKLFVYIEKGDDRI